MIDDDFDELDDPALDDAHPTGDELVAFALEPELASAELADHVADCVLCGDEVETMRINFQAIDEADMTLDPQIEFAWANAADESAAAVPLRGGDVEDEPDEVAIVCAGIRGRVTLRSGRLRLDLTRIPDDLIGRVVRVRCVFNDGSSSLSERVTLRIGGPSIDLTPLLHLTDLLRIRFERE